MLVLTRKLNESIQIGQNITVTVMRITKDKVRLGIEAPREIAIHREDVIRKIEATEDEYC